MSTVEAIIDLWPSPKDFASDVGLADVNHAYVMRNRRSIPRWYWPAIEAAAQRRGLAVTHAMLVETHKNKRQFGTLPPQDNERASV